jgi:aminopeptidase-like protein
MTEVAAPPRLGIDFEALPPPDRLGRELHDLIRELYPLPRSLTGDGNRATFEIINREAPFEIVEVPSGTRVLDWTVPREWNVREGWIDNQAGERVVDAARSNLHLLGYSVPVRKRLGLAELREHLHTLPEHPDWIPYRTSYWAENWGFCISHSQLASLVEGEYEVCIDSTLSDGHMTYAEALVPGETADEVLLSAYACHPSLCNDNLSGVAVLTLLAKYLSGMRLRYSYRFLLSPGTIGPITWLARNEAGLDRVKHGLVAVCLGDSGRMTYKKSRRGDAEIDRAVQCVLRDADEDHTIEEFVPWGGDERQFCSPGIDLAVGSLMRTPHGEFPEYHTSADDLDFVRPEMLAHSYSTYVRVIDLLETNTVYRSTNPKGEPQLGRRGLYRPISAGLPQPGEVDARALLWVLNLADGRHSLLDMAERSGFAFVVLRDAARRLEEHRLLEPVQANAPLGRAAP